MSVLISKQILKLLKSVKEKFQLAEVSNALVTL